MKQVEQSYRRGTLRVVEVPPPVIGAGAVLVASRVSLISSGTEKQLLELAKASLAGKALARPDLVRQVLRTARQQGVTATAQKVLAKLDVPIPMGYSVAGVVVEAGARVRHLHVGQRVACAGAGFANHAELNAVPKNLVVPVPAGVSDAQASFVTLGAIALQGVRQASPTLGEAVVVMGLGLIGLLTVQLLKANGCRVLGFDPDPDRAGRALELGANVSVSAGLEAAVDSFTGGAGADAVLVTASTKSSAPVNTAGEISRAKGRVVVVGLVGMNLQRDIFYKREVDLRLSLSYGPGRHDPDYELSGHDYPLPYVRWTEQRNMEAFLNLVAEGRVTPEKLITHEFAIGDAQKAYQLITDGEPHLAMLLNYPEEVALGSRTIAKPPSRTRKREDRVHVGFVGLGNYAKAVLLPAIRKVAAAELTRVATSTGISANSAAEKYGFESFSTDGNEVIDAPDLDLIFIATRHDSHADYATRALEAGKHVFVEKPLALDLEQLDRVSRAAANSAGILMMGLNRRFAPSVGTAKAALSLAPGPKVMLYRVNAGPVPADSWIRRDEGGGRIIGEMCHFVDLLMHLAGSVPTEVHAIAAGGADDAVSVLMRFADGSTGNVVYSSLGDPSVPKEYIEVFTGGTVVQIEDFSGLVIASAGKRKRSKAAQDKGQSAMVAALFDAVREGAQSPIALDELIAATEATFAIEQSLRTGRPVVLEASRS